MRRLHVFVALFLSLPARAVTIDWVAVDNANNAADTPSANCWAANCGSVDHAYSISKYEITNAQYAEFLNAVGQNGAITRALFNASMHNNPNGGIVQSGVSGSFTYTAFPGFENKPVNFVSFYDSLRFANWLHNGQGGGDTETGAYTLLGGTAIPSNGLIVARNPDATVFLPSENEWYKAAYYSPGGVYFDYPAGTDNAIECAWMGSDTGNSANCNGASGALTIVGVYGQSESPYGTFDQGGNMIEWNEQIVFGSYRGLRGGDWFFDATSLAASNPYYDSPTHENDLIGFRVASLLPEPGPGLLGMTAMLSLAASRSRRANPARL